VRISGTSRALLIALALCAALNFSSCGRKEAAPPTEGGENSPASPVAKPERLPFDQQVEQKLEPLTNEDIELYLKVMQAAASRVQNPTLADKTALEGAKKILAGSASGRVPTPDDVKTLERANLVALAMDQIVANEMKLDGRSYRGIVEAVESVVTNPALGTLPGKGSLPAPEHDLTPLEKHLSDVNAANERFLAPYRAEIQKLMVVVRNPANLPK
jgi:hypothetical protein